MTAYQEERDRRMHAHIAARSARARAILATGWADVADSERVLGYRLARRHLQRGGLARRGNRPTS